MVLGTGGSSTNRPYFDLGLSELSEVQAEIYPGSQEGFWILEDRASNGLTVYQGLTLKGSKQFPINGDTVAFGTARFRWVDQF